MGVTLTGKRVQNTYDSLLKLSDNDNLTGTAKVVGDGLGNDSAIYLSTSKVGIGVTPTYQFQTSGDAKIGANLIVGGNLTVNGSTTIVDSTIVAIGDNMIEMAKDNVSNTMDIGWYGTIVESGTKYVGINYDAGSGITTPTFYIGLGTTEPSSTAEWTVKGKLVIGAIDSTGGTFSGQITIPQTPTADGHAASKKYVDDQIGGADKARRVTITVKNTETVALSAGTVVHAHPTAPVPSGNIVQVKKADYDTASLMPAIAILNEDLDAAGGTNDEGEAIMFGFINGIDTSSFSAGDELYVGNDGALTNSKPLLTTQLIQKIAVVMKVDSTNGSIEVFGAGRSNDVPNEVDRDLSIAGTLKVDDELQVEADSGYGRLEVGGPSGGYIDLKTPFSDDYDLRIITDTTESQFTGAGTFKLNAGNTLTLTLDGTTQDAKFESKVGIGVSASYELDVLGSIKASSQGRFANGSASAPAYSFDADSDSGMYRATTNSLGFSTAGTNALTINSSQKAIFAGDLSAGQGTFVRGSDGYSLRLDSANSGTDNDLRFAKGGTDYGAIQTGSGDNFEFYVNSDGTSSGWIQSFYIERTNGNVNFNYAINSVGNSGGMYFYNTGSGHGVIETMSGKDLNILSGSGDVYVKDNLNLDTGSASTMLKFHSDVATRKISLFEGADNDYEFYGFGIESATLVYSTYTTSDDHVFFAGTSSTSRDELARIKGDGTIRLSQYGSGSFTGTSAYNLAVDSFGNIIETDGDVIDGSGTANYIPKWSDANTLGNSSIYDTGSYTSIGGTDTSGRLTVHSTGDVEYLTLNTTATTNKRVRLQFTQNDNAGLEIATDYSVNNGKNIYFYDRDYGGSAWLFISRLTNWFQGKLGVGFTSGPSTELHVAGSTGLTGFGNCMIMVEDSSDDYSGIIFKGSTNYNAAIRTENGTSLTFWQNGGTGTSWNKRMTLDSSGNLIINGDSALATATNRGNITIDGTNSILSFGLSGSLAGYIFMETGQMLINSGTRHINFEVNSNVTVEFQDNANKLSIGSTNHNWFPYTNGYNYYSADEHIFRSGANSNEFIHMYQNSIYPFRWRRTSSDVQGKLYTDSAGAGIAATDLNYAGMYMVANTSIDWRVNGGVKMILDSNGKLILGNYSYAPNLEFRNSQNGSTQIRFYDYNNTEGTYITATGESYGGNIKFGARWDDDEDKMIIKMLQSSAGGAYDIRVGVGTTSPFSTLDIKHSTNNRAVFSNSSSYGGNVLIGLNDGGGEIGFNIAGSTISFYTNVSKKAYIDSGGLVAYTPTSSNTGGSGDFTNMTAYPLKIDGGPDYWRVPHISPNSTVSGVYNYQSGKNVYWGEPADTGTYYFRGRALSIDSNTQVALNVDTSTTALSMHLGSSTQTLYSNIEMYTNSGNAQIWKAGTAYTSYGGASALNIYNSNGIIAFHPNNTANKVQFYGTGPGVFVNATGYGDNGSGGNDEYAVVGYAESSNQATIGSWHSGDGYANLNLASSNGYYFWHISKRPSGQSHRIEYYWYASGSGFTSRFSFETNGDFHADGDIVAYSTTISDASLKDNVVTIDNALDKVKELRGVTYKWNSGPRNQQKDLGVIAQEVEKVFPEIVYEKQALYHGDKQVKSVDYEKLTAVLIESVKELSAKVEALENRKCNCNCK